MEKLFVSTGNKKYPIYFERNFDGLMEACEEAGFSNGKICIIADSNVDKLYMNKAKDDFGKIFSEVYGYEFQAGEQSKNLNTIMKIYDFCAEKHIDRKSVIACLGGGVCGDMAGFAAATFMRGIKFIQIPTSLLAQVDSSVGGKVGVDFKGNKNMIGAFYQPEFVYMALDVLDSLPEREFAAGMAEVIKYGPISSENFLNFIEKNKEKIKARDKEILKEIITKCCEIKADVVSRDEKDTGKREILNFGHTIGHAVETKKGFELLHGECVALGMKAVLNICEKRGYITKEIVNKICSLLSFFGLPLQTSGITAEEVYKQMFLDKKVKNNVIRFVLMKDFGVLKRTGNVNKEEIISAINNILR
ncbi:MAG: 3-dehydroquinate synthase [Clostridia bacterium]|nr:3-dehydroquinate synthase [Clostridia bacterium]